MFIKGRWYNHSKKKKKIPENELSQESFETDIDFFQICIISKISVELG